MNLFKRFIHWLFADMIQYQTRVDGYRERISAACGGLTDIQWEAIVYDCQTPSAYNGESLWYELLRYEEAAAYGGKEMVLSRIQYGGER